MSDKQPESKIKSLQQMLANRVRKNQRRLRPWLIDEAITCYRLYDRDIPEIPLAVDWYEGRLHVAVYERGGALSDHRDERFRWCIAPLAEALEIPADDVFVKHHHHQTPGQQYDKVSDRSVRFRVQEDGLWFWVNLSDYLNTGLFLDHRRTRQMVGDLAEGRRFLNLFGYTGAFTVYAACNGARATTTVDLSNTYLRWSRTNLEFNGIRGKKHQLVRDDAFEFLKHHRPQDPYDLIVIDPPTASKSKRMAHNFDIQRDYAELIQRSLKMASTGALIFFSTNYRKFKFDKAAVTCSHIQEITQETVPFDFRDKRIHRCWQILK